MPFFILKFGIIHALFQVKEFAQVLEEKKRKEKMEKRLSDWIIIILIILFFSIPVCSLVVTDQVYSWPKYATSFVYQILLK
jgi:hypothetical protein